jgi:excisionase family DNA binding protein
MTKNAHSNNEEYQPEFYSTREAANILGLSLGTIQKMVENGVLSAWKTSGGHRRVMATSVNSYINSRRTKGVVANNKNLSLLVVEDDADLQNVYRLNIIDWGLPIDLTVLGDGYAGLLHIAKARPDIIIMDLNMPRLDGFEMINTLRNDSAFSLMDIIVVTGMPKDEIERSGGLPTGVTVFNKPVSFETLQGYVNAKIAAKSRVF